jgi:hypothetical protein
MQGRSWMAALALATGAALVSFAQDPKAAAPAEQGGVDKKPKSAAPAEQGVVNKVYLVIRVNGLGREGCEVELKPGHAGCKFKPVTKKMKCGDGGFGEVVVEDFEVRSTRVDRDCLFSVTIKEPGLPARTSTRPLRLDRPTATKAVPAHEMVLMLQAPSLAARDDLNKRVK